MGCVCVCIAYRHHIIELSIFSQIWDLFTQLPQFPLPPHLHARQWILKVQERRGRGNNAHPMASAASPNMIKEPYVYITADPSVTPYCITNVKQE